MPSSKEDYESSSVSLLEPFSTKPSSSSSSSSKKTANKMTTSPRASYIGGLPCYFPLDHVQKHSSCRPKCEICHQDMFLILQMYTPLNLEDENGDHNLDRTMLVFGCNNGSCIQQAFQRQNQSQYHKSKGSSEKVEKNSHFVNYQDRFLMGGQGVIRCIRTQQSTNVQLLHSKKEKGQCQEYDNYPTSNDCGEKEESNQLLGWGDDDCQRSCSNEDDDSSDWGFQHQDEKSTNQDSSCVMDDIEAMVAAMELNNQAKAQNKKKKCKTNQGHSRSETNRANTDSTHSVETSMNAFPRFDLDVYDEPCVEKGDSDDEDVTTNNIHDDAAVQSLLSKYLEQEEDSDIVAVIRSGGKQIMPPCGGVGNAKKAGNESFEKYEKLPPDDRAFLTFAARIKRAPRQSVRYEYGGTPIWSIPTPNFASSSTSKRRERNRDVPFPSVPPCPCGANRYFEFQLMPSILHVLNVDNYATAEHEADASSKNIQTNELFGKFSGGMNWGTVAIYSCSVSCREYREEYVIVQESVDGDPKRVETKVVPSNEIVRDDAKSFGNDI